MVPSSFPNFLFQDQVISYLVTTENGLTLTWSSLEGCGSIPGDSVQELREGFTVSEHVIVTLQLSNLLVSSAGSCGSYGSCGHVKHWLT